jgi:ABC-2 type transport system ATP-binding protein
MIRLEEIRKTYRSEFLRRPRPVLRGLSIHVLPGETYALLGANGAGKTTTMKILLGLIRRDGGAARIDGLPVENPLSRLRLGYLPEHPYFLPHLKGEELVRYYGRLSGLDRCEASRRADRLLARMRIREAGGRIIRSYSKGMLQRLGFAQALVADPALLVLDEPLSGLDPVGRKEMRELLLELKGEGKTILLSSHILEDVERLSDRAGFLADGTIRREVEGEGREWIELFAEGLDAERTSAAELEAERIAREGERILVELRREEDVPRVRDRISARGGRVVRVERRHESLEDLFVENVVARSGTADAE